MTKPGAHVYALLRDTLAKTRANVAPDEALALERVETILTRLIVDDRDLPAFRETREAGLKALAGKSGKDADAQAVKLELDYYTAYENAALEEFKASAAKPVDDSDDQPADDFDMAKVEAWMRKEFPAEPDLKVVSHKVASRGFSKKTELVELSGVKTIPSSLAFRVDQEFNYLGTKVTEEYPTLKYLYDHGVRLPQPFALEPTGEVLGHPFIVSAKVGGAPIGSLYTFPPRDEAVVADMARCMADLHKVPTEGFPEIHPTPPGATHLDIEIDKYYADWQALSVDNQAMEAAFRWIKDHREMGRGKPAVVHNDYGFNNILIDGSRVEAVVDWEFVHIGVAAADVGYFFYSAENVASYDFFLKKYQEAGGVLPPKEAIDFYKLWGQMRLAVMGWQVEVGFNKGEFSDVRFGFSGAITLRKAMVRVTSLLLDLVKTYG